MLPAAGHRDELIGPSAQLVANVRDEKIEIAVAADQAREDLAADRRGRSEDHRLDAAHPFAPSQLGRKIGELRIERSIGFGAPGHR